MSAHARADGGVDRAAYDRAIDEGVKEFDLGNFQEAREQFRRAHEIAPSARTLRGLGMVEFELRNYGESAAYLEQSLISTVKPLDDRLRVEVEGLLERSRGYLGELHVSMKPAAATVLVDGAEVALGPEETLTLQVGDHVLEFRAQGHLPARRKVQIKGGHKETVQVTLSPLLNETGPLAMSNLAQSDKQDRPLRKQWWLWTLVGSVVAGGVATAAVLLTRDPGSKEVPLVTPSGVSFRSLEVRP